MAAPLQSAKSTVNLAAGGTRVSKIRRDPPPLVKEITLVDVAERDAWTVVLGIALFALSLFVIVLGFSAFAGHKSEPYTVHVDI